MGHAIRESETGLARRPVWQCLGVADEIFLPFGSLSSLAFGYGHQRDGNEYDLRPSAVPPRSRASIFRLIAKLRDNLGRYSYSYRLREHNLFTVCDPQLNSEVI